MGTHTERYTAATKPTTTAQPTAARDAEKSATPNSVGLLRSRRLSRNADVRRCRAAPICLVSAVSGFAPTGRLVLWCATGQRACVSQTGQSTAETSLLSTGEPVAEPRLLVLAGAYAAGYITGVATDAAEPRCKRATVDPTARQTGLGATAAPLARQTTCRIPPTTASKPRAATPTGEAVRATDTCSTVAR